MLFFKIVLSKYLNMPVRLSTYFLSMYLNIQIRQNSARVQIIFTARKF